MRAYSKVSSLFLICIALTLEAHAGQLSQAQVEAVKSQYFPLNGAPSINLHNAPRAFSDGAKGFTKYYVPENGWESFKPYANKDDENLHEGYCSSSAVVSAKNISSRTYLSEAKDTLITVSDFTVTDVIKGDPQGFAQVGNTIKVSRIGGEIIDQGEKLRVTFAGRPDYIVGKKYLLFLRGKPATDSMPFRADSFITVRIVNNRVYPSDKTWLGFREGDTDNSIVSRIHQLSAKFQCPGK
jgi:hypothetical protein